MTRRSFAGVPDHVLLRNLAALVARDRATTAELLDHIAEVDDRKLYLPAGYASMFLYCLSELRMSEDVTYKRLQAARAAREFPPIFEMVKDGRLHLTAVVLLAPHLTRENAADLLAAATNRTKAEIELLIAERFPKPDQPTVLEPVAGTQRAPASNPVVRGETDATPQVAATSSKTLELVPEPVAPLDDASVAPAAVPVAPRARIAPLAPERFALQVTLSRATHDKLRRAQELLSHALPSSEIAEVLDRALDVLVASLEQRRFATTSRPSARRRSKSARHIPAHVRREVSDRDRYQCTFVSATGKRCAEKRFLEYDHVHPVARGGQPTVENTRLRCRAHNQFEAERIYGAGFMREKRADAKARAKAVVTRSSGAGASHAAGV